jgi:hypothetical protein
MYLFIICLFVRSLLAYFAMNYHELILYFTTITGFTFWILYLFNLRQVAGESTAKGKNVWWNNLRPVHGSIYLLFSYLYYKGNEKAYLVLVLDVVLGLFVWLNKENETV